MKCFYTDERASFFYLLDEDLDRIAKSSIRLGGYALFTSLFGEWELGKELLGQVFENNLNVPLWLYGVSSLYYYRKSDYENALKEAKKYQIPGVFWMHIHSLVALSQLGRLEKAEKEFQALLKLRPDFVDRGRYLMSIYLKEDTLLEHHLEGFSKMGVELS